MATGSSWRPRTCIQHENDHLDGITIMESSEYFYEDTEEGKKAAREAKGNN